MKNKYYVWDGINSQIEECTSLAHAKATIKEIVYDENDGYHPDAESVFILEKSYDTIISDRPHRLVFK